MGRRVACPPAVVAGVVRVRCGAGLACLCRVFCPCPGSGWCCFGWLPSWLPGRGASRGNVLQRGSVVARSAAVLCARVVWGVTFRGDLSGWRGGLTWVVR